MSRRTYTKWCRFRIDVEPLGLWPLCGRESYFGFVRSMKIEDGDVFRVGRGLCNRSQVTQNYSHYIAPSGRCTTRILPTLTLWDSAHALRPCMRGLVSTVGTFTDSCPRNRSRPLMSSDGDVLILEAWFIYILSSFEQENIPRQFYNKVRMSSNSAFTVFNSTVTNPATKK